MLSFEELQACTRACSLGGHVGSSVFRDGLFPWCGGVVIIVLSFDDDDVCSNTLLHNN